MISSGCALQPEFQLRITDKEVVGSSIVKEALMESWKGTVSVNLIRRVGRRRNLQ